MINEIQYYLIQAGEIESPIFIVAPKQPKKIRIFWVIITTEFVAMPDNFFVRVENAAFQDTVDSKDQKSSKSLKISKS